MNIVSIKFLSRNALLSIATLFKYKYFSFLKIKCVHKAIIKTSFMYITILAKDAYKAKKPTHNYKHNKPSQRLLKYIKIKIKNCL